MDQTHLIYRLGVAIAIGLLLGLQREHDYDQENIEDTELFAGARTFALFSVLGFVAAMITEQLESSAGFVSVVAMVGVMIVTSYAISARKGNLGLTTEVAAFITLLIGAICFWDELVVAAAIGVLTAILLALKVRTQSLVDNLTREDIYATLKFAFISIIVLPLLPREGYGSPPLDVIVPFNVWLMVVFISGISFLGYALIKIVGVRKGVGLTGILGGLASSTAVTMSFAQQSRDFKDLAHPFALAIILSWTVMIVRVTIEILTINAPLLRVMWLPILIVIICCAAYSAYLYIAKSSDQQETTEQFTNPFELQPAFMFALLYAGVLLGSNFAEMYYGNTGIYISSILSGLVDVDAITLSMSKMSQQGGPLEMAVAARAIILAVVSNTIVKGGIVLLTGSASLRKIIIPGLLLITASAIASVFLLT